MRPRARSPTGAPGAVCWGSPPPSSAGRRSPAATGSWPSLETAEANAGANGVEMSIERIDVREGPPPVAPTVVANLTGNLLRECAVHLAASGEAPDTLVCSGMLEGEMDGVAEAFAPTGLSESERRVENDWGALLMRAARPADGACAERRASDRRLRLRRRRAHRPPRVPRLAPGGGLRLFGGRRALSVRGPIQRRAARSRRAGHPLPARPRGQAAGDRLQLRLLGGPRGGRGDRGGGRGGGGRRDPARGGDRRSAHPVRQRRGARNARDGAERRLSAGPLRGAPRA